MAETGGAKGGSIPGWGWALIGGTFGAAALVMALKYEPSGGQANPGSTGNSLLASAKSAATSIQRKIVTQEGPNHKLETRPSFSDACLPAKQYACTIAGRNGTCCDR